MEPVLPDDILRMICDELGERRDFSTLFSCSTVNRTFGDAALTTLYRTQHHALGKDEIYNETVSLAEQELITQRWSVLWRTIILSCLGHSLIKYVQYIKALDLRDLDSLFNDPFFRNRVSENFFEGPMKSLQIMQGSQVRTREGVKRPPRLNIGATLAAIGDIITQHAPQIEVISGPVTAQCLVKWIPRVPKLRSLELFDGSALEHIPTGALLKEHCSNFNLLSYFIWSNPDADHFLSTLIRSLPEQSLQTFITLSTSGVAAESCKALKLHGNSLKELRLVLMSDELRHLSSLDECIMLETLDLKAGGASADDFEETHNIEFKGIQTWLRNCKNLRVLELRDIPAAAALLTPVLADDTTKLERLDVSSYLLKDRNAFHLSLVHQPSLQTLILDSEPIEVRDDLDTLSTALSALPNLRLLRLIDISQHFAERHVEALVESHVLLEELYIGGQLRDSSLLALSRLPNIRILTLSGITTFSFEAFTAFIDELGPANYGMSLIIDNADPSQGLSEDEQTIIRQSLASVVGGRFVYEYFRDPEELDFSADSD